MWIQFKLVKVSWLVFIFFAIVPHGYQEDEKPVQPQPTSAKAQDAAAGHGIAE
jgi:hypothetical protein